MCGQEQASCDIILVKGVRRRPSRRVREEKKKKEKKSGAWGCVGGLGWIGEVRSLVLLHYDLRALTTDLLTLADATVK